MSLKLHQNVQRTKQANYKDSSQFRTASAGASAKHWGRHFMGWTEGCGSPAPDQDLTHPSKSARATITGYFMLSC